MMKNSSYKIQMLDNKYNNILNSNDIDLKNDYIFELENQIQLRDDLLKELEAEFTKAVSGKASEQESNSIPGNGESQAQANSEQTPQA